MIGSKAHVGLSLGVVAALVFAGTARADDPPPPDDVAAADAYRESVPTAGGAKPTGRGKGQAKLDPAVSARLGSDPTSTLLREVATSAAYGAPQQRLSRPKARPLRADDKRVPPASLPSLGAASGAVGEAVGGGRLAFLAVLLVGVLLGGVGVRLAAARAGTR